MEKFQLRYPATQVLVNRSMAGVVGSGDLEVLYEPMGSLELVVNIETTVSGRQQVWQNVLSRINQLRGLPAGKITIHDSGATPGVVRLRIEQAFDKASGHANQDSVSAFPQNSFIELSARERAKALLDQGSFKELLEPFNEITSPWLEEQGIAIQSDDGMVIAKGTIQGTPTVVAAIEGVFQGGSMGEISGAKMAAALSLAAEDNRNGIKTHAVLLLETGGVRLQEANLGLAAIADIHAAIVDLRRYVPVVGIVAGTVGCFGGMSIAAALCSSLIVTQEARIGLNGPQVIEQEAGIEEYNSRSRPFIWSMTGGEVRYRNGFADAYTKDSIEAVRFALLEQMKAKHKPLRSEQYDYYLNKILQIDTQHQVEPDDVNALLGIEGRV